MTCCCDLPPFPWRCRVCYNVWRCRRALRDRMPRRLCLAEVHFALGSGLKIGRMLQRHQGYVTLSPLDSRSRTLNRSILFAHCITDWAHQSKRSQCRQHGQESRWPTILIRVTITATLKQEMPSANTRLRNRKHTRRSGLKVIKLRLVRLKQKTLESHIEARCNRRA